MTSFNRYLNILLQKSDPLMEWGFDIVGGRDTGSSLIISKIKQGTFCSQYLSEGDAILQIDGIDAASLSNAEALAFVRRPSKSLDLIVLKNGKSVDDRKYSEASSVGSSGNLADNESSTSDSNCSTLERKTRFNQPVGYGISKRDDPKKIIHRCSSDDSVLLRSSCTNSMEIEITGKAGSWRYYPNDKNNSNNTETELNNLEDDPMVKHRCKETRNFWKELEAGKNEADNICSKKTNSNNNNNTSFRDFNSEYLAYDKIEVYEKVEDYQTGYCNVKAETGLELSAEFVKSVIAEDDTSNKSSAMINSNLLPKSYEQFRNKSSFQSLRTSDEENSCSLTSVDTISGSSVSSNENFSCSIGDSYCKDHSNSSGSEFSSSSGYSSSGQRGKQTSVVTADNSYVPITNNDNTYGYASDRVNDSHLPPPPPPPLPSVAGGNIPSVRLKSEIPNRSEPPATIQNAMMTKDKKPFTYTPGGIDLSQIKSPIMQKRIVRNAQSPPDYVPPPQSNNLNSPNSVPASVAASMTPHLAIPVLPAQDLSVAIKNLNPVASSAVYGNSNVDSDKNDVKSISNSGVIPGAQLNKTPPPTWLQKPAVQSQDNTPPWANKNSNNNSVQKSPAGAASKFTPQTSPHVTKTTIVNDRTNLDQNGARVIPIQIEGAEQKTTNDQNRQNRWSNVNGNQCAPQSRIRSDNERTAVSNLEVENNQPVQSRSFKVLQRITSSDEDNSTGAYNEIGDIVYNSEGVPLNQLRKMHLSDDDRSFMNKVKTQVDEEHYLHTETDPRYRGSSIPSKAFRMLQNMTDSGQAIRNTESPVYNQTQTYSENRNFQNGQQNVYIPPSERQVDEDIRKYTGSSIPSRSFRILQAMTATEPTSTTGRRPDETDF